MTREEFVSALADLERSCVALGASEVCSKAEMVNGERVDTHSASVLAAFDALIEKASAVDRLDAACEEVANTIAAGCPFCKNPESATPLPCTCGEWEARAETILREAILRTSEFVPVSEQEWMDTTEKAGRFDEAMGRLVDARTGHLGNACCFEGLETGEHADWCPLRPMTWEEE